MDIEKDGSRTPVREGLNAAVGVNVELELCSVNLISPDRPAVASSFGRMMTDECDLSSYGATLARGTTRAHCSFARRGCDTTHQVDLHRTKRLAYLDVSCVEI